MYQPWDGNNWEQFVIGLLQEKHKNDGFQRVPSSGGDGGIDGWAGNGTVYQCYAAEGLLPTKELAKRQKEKISDDIKKFHGNAHVLSKIIGTNPERKIDKWILMVPNIANKEVLEFCQNKTKELREIVTREKIPYASSEIQIYIHDLLSLRNYLQNIDSSTFIRVKYAGPWARCIADSPLWGKAEDTAGIKDALRDTALALAGACSYAASGDDRSERNRWIDRKVPERTVHALADLVEVSEPSPPLSVVEVALLLTAPFLREAAIANAESRALKECDPFHPNPGGSIDTPIRRALRLRWQKQPRITRRIDALRSRGNSQAADDTACWLLRRAVNSMPGLWLRGSRGGLLSDDILGEIDAIVGSGDTPLAMLDSIKKDPFLFARFVGADIDRLRGGWQNNQSLPSIQRLPPVLGKGIKDVIRPRFLTALLALAGKQALDPLELGSVLVDHIGLTDPLTPLDIILHTQRSAGAWERAKAGGIVLTIDCKHPAIDTAFTDNIQSMDILRRWLMDHESDWLPKQDKASLPEYTDCITATVGDDFETPLYERRQVRFTMEADQVKELLMGAQLYGDPALAIRELYQNALDACRYRRAREQYLERTEPGISRAWKGEIIIEQGIDSEGRPYIECRDNGVGMDEHVLISCFARAGKRFTDTDEHLEERCDWDALSGEKIELWPNSRFGIGVFSYFMLADEVNITTRRFMRDGNFGDTLTVNIDGSGSLFRVSRNIENREPGSTIRLYLSQGKINNGEDSAGISVISFLENNLILSEFPVTAQFNDIKIKWPGGWKQRKSYKSGDLLPTEEDSVFWWIPFGFHPSAGIGECIILNDGIIVNEFGWQSFDRFSELAPILNLFGPNAPNLTVDRQKILDFNEEAANKKLNNISFSMLTKKSISFHDLASISYKYPLVAQNTINELIINNNFTLKILNANFHKNSWISDGDACINIKDFGVCGGDYIVIRELLLLSEVHKNTINVLMSRSPYPKIFSRERIVYIIKKLDRRGHIWPKLEGRLNHNSMDTYDKYISPVDSIILSRDLNSRPPWLVDYIYPSHILKAASKTGESIDKIVKRLRRLAPLGLVLPNEREIQRLEEDL